MIPVAGDWSLYINTILYDVVNMSPAGYVVMAAHEGSQVAWLVIATIGFTGEKLIFTISYNLLIYTFFIQLFFDLFLLVYFFIP